MTRTRRGAISLVLLIGIAVAALIAGMQVQQSYKPHTESQADQLKAAGRNLGGAIAGPPGAALGENVGLLLALAFGITAAHRHAAAAASNAQLRMLTSTPATPAAK